MLYHGNQLIAVEDAVPTHYNYDFRNGNVYSGADEYAYDANGNMTRDDNKGITVTYNELNLPTEVDFGNDNRIEWIYSASGEKLRKTVYFSGGVSVVTDYIGSFVYKDGALDFFHTSEGRVEHDNGSFEYQYAIKDHLGNTRVLFAASDSDTLVIKQVVHYYPFGLQLAGIGSTGGSDNKFLYNGKELEDEHNLYWYHYGARYYDPQLGMWHSIDPADEFYSPYVGMGNNPMVLTDPDGMDVWYFNNDGSLLYIEEYEEDLAFIYNEDLPEIWEEIPFEVTYVADFASDVIWLSSEDFSKLGPDATFFDEHQEVIFNGIDRNWINTFFSSFQETSSQENGVTMFSPGGLVARMIGGKYGGDVSNGRVNANSFFIFKQKYDEGESVYIIWHTKVDWKRQEGLYWDSMSRTELLNTRNTLKGQTIFKVFWMLNK